MQKDKQVHWGHSGESILPLKQWKKKEAWEWCETTQITGT